jgi:hypothetical protein
MDAHDNDRLPNNDYALPHFPTGWQHAVTPKWPDDRLREITLHAAAAAFLAEYETYQKDPNSVIFNPTPAVLEALRKSLGAQS